MKTVTPIVSEPVELTSLTHEIKGLARETIENIISIGKKLLQAKELMPHGEWGNWLQQEFDWSQDTAGNFMNVAKQFPQLPEGTDFTAEALYILARNSVPPEARAVAVAEAKKGKVTAKKAKKIKKATKEYDDNVPTGEGIYRNGNISVLSLDGADVLGAGETVKFKHYSLTDPSIGYVYKPDSPEHLFEVKKDTVAIQATLLDVPSVEVKPRDLFAEEALVAEGGYLNNLHQGLDDEVFAEAGLKEELDPIEHLQKQFWGNREIGFYENWQKATFLSQFQTQGISVGLTQLKDGTVEELLCLVSIRDFYGNKERLALILRHKPCLAFLFEDGLPSLMLILFGSDERKVEFFFLVESMLSGVAFN